MRPRLAISAPISFGLFSSPPHSARLHGVDDHQARIAAVAPGKVGQRRDDFGGDIVIAKVERPAHHPDRQPPGHHVMLDAERQRTARHYRGAFQRNIQHGGLFHLAAEPRQPRGQVQPDVLRQHRLARTGFAVERRQFADRQEVVHQPLLAAHGRHVGIVGAWQNACGTLAGAVVGSDTRLEMLGAAVLVEMRLGSIDHGCTSSQSAPTLCGVRMKTSQPAACQACAHCFAAAMPTPFAS